MIQAGSFANRRKRTPWADSKSRASGQFSSKSARIYRETQACRAFLVGFIAGPGLAVTITFTNAGLAGSDFDRYRSCEKTVQHLLRRINKRVFRHGYARRGFRIWSIAVLEVGGLGGRFHAHLALGLPPSISLYDFMDLVRLEVKSCDFIARQTDIRPMASAGWAGYLAKEGPSTALWSCCHYAVN